MVVREVEPDHLLVAVSACRRTLEPLVEHDWAVPAGDLSWTVRETVAHVADTAGWYAAQLAMRSPGWLRFDFRAHAEASNAELLDVVEAAAATLAHVARAAPRDARAFHPFGLADTSGFLAMGCGEILVHTWDASRGLEAEFAAPVELAEQVLCRLFPWAPPDASPWRALLWANDRVDLSNQVARPGPGWAGHCAPLDEWDGSVPGSEANR